MSRSKPKKKSSKVLGNLMKFLIPMAITVGLCWLMFHRIDFKQMLNIIRTQCNFFFIGLALFISIFPNFFRAFRWNLQLEALGIKTPKRILVYSIFGTYAINLLFPRLGEVWRTGYISQRQKAPFSTVFGSMIADRLSDTLTVFLILVFAFLIASNAILDYLGQNGDMLHHLMMFATSPWLWLALIVAALFSWWFLTRKSRAGSVLDKVQKFFRGLWDGFIVLVKMPKRGQWLFWTVCLWGCYFLQMVIEFYAFPFTREAIQTHGFIVPLLTYVLSSLAMGVPSNGGIGPWQWAAIFAMSIYSIDVTDASAFANLVMGLNTLLVIVLGLYAFIAIMIDKRRNSRSSSSSRHTMASLHSENCKLKTEN